MALIPTAIVATRPFQYVDGPMGVPQVVGFWDEHTAVLFGYDSAIFRRAAVGLAAVLTDHPAFGPALCNHDLPNQYDTDVGPYGEPTPPIFVAFLPISATKAIMVTAVVLSSAANEFGVIGNKSEVSYVVMTRASVTAYDFTFSAPTLAGTAWAWPEGAVDFGAGSASDYAVQVLVGIAGTETEPVGLSIAMTEPGPSRVFQYMGPITIGSSISVNLVTGFDVPGPFGQPTLQTGQAVVLNAEGNFDLVGAPSMGAGVINRALAGGLLHADQAHVHSPQIVGTYTPDSTGVPDGSAARLCWGEILTANTVSFHSVAVNVATPDIKYGAPVSLPTGVVGDVVALEIAADVTNLAYVPVTLTVSDAVRDDASWHYSGTATVYGTIMDFRSNPLLRSDWFVLGSWDYRDMPGQPFLSVTGVTDTEVDLAWTAVEGGAPIGGMAYDLYRDGDLIASPSGSSYADTGRTPGSHYIYTMVAHDSAGNYGPFAQLLGVSTTAPDIPPDTTPPSTPILEVVGTTAHSATFRVSATDDRAVAYVRIFMTGHVDETGLVDDLYSPEIPLSLAINPDGTLTVDWTSTNTGPGTHEPYFALDNQAHYYCARAFDTSGNGSLRSAYGESGQITLAAVDHPTQTGDPNITGTTGVPKTGITFTWGISTSSFTHTSAGIVVDIYRSGTLLATVPATTTSYTDSFPAHSQPHYQLQARNAAGWKSLISNSVPNWVTLGD